MSLFGSSLKIKPSAFPDPRHDLPLADQSGRAIAVLAGGCFWCTEAVYEELDGVFEVVSGYSGGDEADADYKKVCTGTTEHAEVIQIAYDPAKTTYGQLLKIFFAVAHDPTHVNRQGNDRGTQYRSAIFYADDQQRQVAEDYIAQIEQADIFNAPIATRLEPLTDFFEAEAYHQGYAAQNQGAGYIQAVAMPKVEKLRQYFGDQLK